MFEKIIEFSCLDKYVNTEKEKDTFPTPVKLNIPKWFKEMKHTVEARNVKGCIPFLDSLTTGYLLKVPQDIVIYHGHEEKINDKLQKVSKQHNSFINFYGAQTSLNLNYNNETSLQSIEQAKGWPDLTKKNQGGPIHKIINPWLIKTPPGYSSLFLPVLNNNQEKFEIIPGIVDTDIYDQEVNFPILLSGFDKVPIDYMIKRGTPYCQVIPFKRDAWKMKITGRSSEEMRWTHFIFNNSVIDVYKRFFWRKKSFK